MKIKNRFHNQFYSSFVEIKTMSLGPHVVTYSSRVDVINESIHPSLRVYYSCARSLCYFKQKENAHTKNNYFKFKNRIADSARYC